MGEDCWMLAIRDQADAAVDEVAGRQLHLWLHLWRESLPIRRLQVAAPEAIFWSDEAFPTFRSEWGTIVLIGGEQGVVA